MITNLRFKITMTILVNEESDSIESHKREIEEVINEGFSNYALNIEDFNIEEIK